MEKQKGLLDMLFKQGQLPELKVAVEIENASLLKLCVGVLLTAVLILVIHQVIKKS